MISSDWSTRRHLLSAGTRAAWELHRQPLKLTGSNLDKVAAGAVRPQSHIAILERLLVLLADRTARFGRPYNFTPATDYPLIAAEDGDEAHAYILGCIALGWLRRTRPLLTVDGWRKVDELRTSAPKSHQAFVAMWFDKSMDAAWLEGFKPGIEASQYYEPVRVDGVQHNGKIDDRIVAEIKRSAIMVADFTGQRGGVYFEAGLATGREIPVIWTCRADHLQALHFDTRQYNYIVWNNPVDLRDRLTDRILATLIPKSV